MIVAYSKSNAKQDKTIFALQTTYVTSDASAHMITEDSFLYTNKISSGCSSRKTGDEVV